MVGQNMGKYSNIKDYKNLLRGGTAAVDSITYFEKCFRDNSISQYTNTFNSSSASAIVL